MDFFNSVGQIFNGFNFIEIIFFSLMIILITIGIAKILIIDFLSFKKGERIVIILTIPILYWFFSLMDRLFKNIFPNMF